MGAFYALLFLPHGVRVLTFYFFGWMGYVYLLPASLLMWAISNYSGQNALLFMSFLTAMVSCHIGVILVKYLFEADDRLGAFTYSWRNVLIAGIVGSLLNSVSQTWLYESDLEMQSLLGYFIGDVTGQFALMLIILSFVRIARMIADLPDK